MKIHRTFKTILSLLLVSSLLFSCDEDEVIAPIGEIVLTQAAMTNISAQQIKVNLSWVYGGNASQLQHYRIEYSLHHGTWVALTNTVANTDNSVEMLLPATDFYVGNAYDWRVIAVGQTEEAISCYREASLAMQFGLKLPSTAFDQNTEMYLNFTTTNQGLFDAGIHPVIEELQGNQWVQIVDNTSNTVGVNGFVNLPQIFVANKTYRIKLHGAESYYGINTNYVVFTYAAPHPNPCCEMPAITERPTLETATMGPQMVYRKLNLTWSHPNIQNVTAFKVQYSLNHSDWKDFGTYSNQILSLDLPNLAPTYNEPTGPMLSNSYYRWRVVAIGQNSYPAYSCSRNATLDMGNQELQARPCYLKLTNPDFTNTLELRLSLPNNATAASSAITWKYQVSRYENGTWVNQGSEVPFSPTVFPYNLSVAIGNISPLQPYRITINRYFNGATTSGSNPIEFYNKPWPTENGICG